MLRMGIPAGEQFEEKLPEYLKGCKTLYYCSGKAFSFDDEMLELLARVRRVFIPRQIVDPRFLLGFARRVVGARCLHCVPRRTVSRETALLEGG